MMSNLTQKIQASGKCPTSLLASSDPIFDTSALPLLDASTDGIAIKSDASASNDFALLLQVSSS